MCGLIKKMGYLLVRGSNNMHNIYNKMYTIKVILRINRYTTSVDLKLAGGYAECSKSLPLIWEDVWKMCL